MTGLRTVETQNNSEVYVNLNDLIIDLMVRANDAVHALERETINAVIAKLVVLRTNGHGAKSIRVPGSTLKSTDLPSE
jgi:hypothetical protein